MKENKQVFIAASWFALKRVIPFVFGKYYKNIYDKKRLLRCFVDRSECLIFLKNQEKTEKILSLTRDHKTGLFHVRFNGSEEKEYSYRPDDIKIYKPEILNPDFNTVYFDGKLFTGLNGIYRYIDAGYWYLEKGENSYLISDNKLKVFHSALENNSVSTVLAYLKEISFVSSIKDEEGNRILSKRYRQIDFVNEDSVLADYLSGDKKVPSHPVPSLIIYPFGTNKSQKQAVVNALSNKISIIQGPPGTGKTQTILTIIANLILQKKTAEIVSNNNSAVDNVKEKLERYGLSFLLASLGSSENKEKFISSQTGIYPDISTWKINDTEIKTCSSRIREISEALDDFYEILEKKQKRQSELSELDTEILHFSDILSSNPEITGDELSSEDIIKLSQKYSIYFQRHDRFSFFRRIAAVFIQKGMNWKDSADLGINIMQLLQWRYYCKRKEELKKEIELLESQILQFDMHGKNQQLSDLSLRVLKGILYKRLEGKTNRPLFSEEDLWKNPEMVIAEYPIVTSTAFSSSAALGNIMYDYVIIDEASQCDIASGALSLLSARNATIVGDIRQLQNVVTEEDKDYTESIFKKYSIPEAYRYSALSFLASISALFPDISSVMLSEHYRCQPKIIGFCNEKFYGNNLVVMTEDKKRQDELGLFLTASGYHSREHSNLRQAEVIANEILPSLSEKHGSIGIITPYQNNVKLIRNTIKRDDIKVDTIHSFQGREMDTIIFSTSDDIVTDFSDSAMLLNVAVSRAKNHFILVTSSDPQPAKSNINDLISYISYNSFKPVRSGIVSIFDMLYEQSSSARIEFLSKHRKISEYDSENLMFSALENIIGSITFRESGFRIACHYPVRYLFRDTDLLTDEERLYLSKTGTHVDFLIYRAIGKNPVVAIEVDGFHYHKKGSRQYERDTMKDSIFSKYGLPLLRFKTNGSGEVEQISDFLKQYISQ